MKHTILLGALCLFLVSGVIGCQSLHVGGSGNVGGISAGGGISIPVPHK